MENAGQRNTHPTQNGERVSRRLAGVRKAASNNKEMKFATGSRGCQLAGVWRRTRGSAVRSSWPSSSRSLRNFLIRLANAQPRSS